jgi:hypothetical protein
MIKSRGSHSLSVDAFAFVAELSRRFLAEVLLVLAWWFGLAPQPCNSALWLCRISNDIKEAFWGTGTGVRRMAIGFMGRSTALGVQLLLLFDHRAGLRPWCKVL